jgi:hypothetical protein
MTDSRFSRDDIIPMLADSGIAATLAPWIRKNASEEYMRELVQIEHGIILKHAQLSQLISDLNLTGALDGCDLDNMPTPITRPAKPSGIGCGSGNVWVTPPGEVYTLRFYVNGVQKATLENYYITDLAGLNAAPGDIVQVAQVVGGIVGWWTRILVQ